MVAAIRPVMLALVPLAALARAGPAPARLAVVAEILLRPLPQQRPQGRAAACIDLALWYEGGTSIVVVLPRR